MKYGFAAIALLIALAGCSAKQPSSQGNQTQSHDEMRLTFRATFLNSCEQKVPGAQGIAYCSCTEDKIETAFNDAQLNALKADDPKLREMMHACASKAGLKVRAGQ